jgi:hypothetical protein
VKLRYARLFYCGRRGVGVAVLALSGCSEQWMRSGANHITQKSQGKTDVVNLGLQNKPLIGKLVNADRKAGY